MPGFVISEELVSKRNRVVTCSFYPESPLTILFPSVECVGIPYILCLIWEWSHLGKKPQ